MYNFDRHIEHPMREREDATLIINKEAEREFSTGRTACYFRGG